MKKLVLFSFLFIFVLISQSYAYTDKGTYYECNSCDDCEAAIADNTYDLIKLTADISDYAGTCINNPANFSNKTFDCQGHTIDGDDSGNDYGIFLSGKTNNTIGNCTVTDFKYGIYLYSSSSNNITNNTANSNTYYGIYLYSSSSNNAIINNTANSNTVGIYLDYSSNNNALISNTANSNGYGIYLESSSSNTLTNNTANSNACGIYLESSSNNAFTNNTANSNTQYGIYLESSSSNTLTNNTMSNNTYNFYIYGSSVSHYIQSIATSNTVDGKPIYYWNYTQDAEINETTNAGFVGLVSCNNITVKNLNISKNTEGILFVNTTNSTILNNTANSNACGIYLYSSSNNNITSNTANSNGYGIYLASSSNNNTLTNNTANSNTQYGIYLYSSSSNTLTNNTANSNTYYGILFYSSSNNNITNNTANSNNYGIYLESSSNNNTFTNNTANSNGYGIYLASSSNNNITNNTLKWNVDDIRETSSSGNNYESNTLYLNKNTAFLNLLTSEIGNISEKMFFNISLKLPNGTVQNLSAVNSVQASPSFTLAYNNTTTDIFGNITPAKLGIYSIKLNLTDSNNNEIYHILNLYAINSSRNFSTRVKYYLRPGIGPVHGQPTGNDAKSLLFSKPTGTEIFSCSAWVQASPDVMPALPNGTIQNATINHWYKASGSPYIGLQRKVAHDTAMDTQASLSAASEYTFNSTTFTSINWAMNDKYDWYNLSFKLRGNNPYWLSSPTKLSYITIDYITNAPAPLTQNPVGLTVILSTLSQENLRSAEIILDGEGTKTIELKMPELDTYKV
ncbi:MAG: right-handed parallel beta-helix repeat-containing protein, partial [Candidatus Aenigmarchaeota archaeon]|nr:right-handed parallel beta-helix repeat-containing protein [Candidatus Aenigmarchaeota archaeon]